MIGAHSNGAGTDPSSGLKLQHVMSSSSNRRHSMDEPGAWREAVPEATELEPPSNGPAQFSGWKKIVVDNGEEAPHGRLTTDPEISHAVLRARLRQSLNFEPKVPGEVAQVPPDRPGVVPSNVAAAFSSSLFGGPAGEAPVAVAVSNTVSSGSSTGTFPSPNNTASSPSRMGYGARKSIEIAQREDAEFVDKSPSRGTAGEPREGEEEEEEGIDEGNMVPSSASSESGLVTVLK